MHFTLLSLIKTSTRHRPIKLVWKDIAGLVRKGRKKVVRYLLYGQNAHTDLLEFPYTEVQGEGTDRFHRVSLVQIKEKKEKMVMLIKGCKQGRERLLLLLYRKDRAGKSRGNVGGSAGSLDKLHWIYTYAGEKMHLCASGGGSPVGHWQTGR